jgi:hypothetical protein
MKKKKILITSLFPQDLINKLEKIGDVIVWKTNRFDLMIM